MGLRILPWFRRSFQGWNAPKTKKCPQLFYQVDPVFRAIYDQGKVRTGMTSDNLRRERFYNLVQMFLLTAELSGRMAECGCWKGLSSFLLCHYLKRERPEFAGEGYYVLDSFQGLSEPTPDDRLPERTLDRLMTKAGCIAGAFRAGLDQVREVLAEFPQITFHPGWIPQSLQGMPEQEYRFVHVDVDLYEPTRGAVEYFYPRLCKGGLLICDDYGSLFWPGAKQAIDEFAASRGLRVTVLSTGQAILWKRP